MSNANQYKNHLSLANKNHQALQCLMADSQKHSEWIATVAYYKAAQVVEAVLVLNQAYPARLLAKKF